MITKKTVLVLGAGASMPYGFPSGQQLVEYIVNAPNGAEHLLKAGIEVKELMRFCSALRESATPSIDSFLEHRKEFIAVGKACIAHFLIRYENPDLLYAPGADKWYQTIANKLDSTIDRFPQNNLSIITFNYDRSLDHFLFRAFFQRWNVSQDEAAAAFKFLPIVHPHGQIGLLSWQSGNSADRREYASNSTPADILIAARGIKIISEPALENSSEFQKARDLLNDAERIYILGFGYHADNMRRLDLPNTRAAARGDDRTIVGTCHGYTGTEQATLENRHKGIAFVPLKILDLLRNNPKFVSDT